MLVDPTDGARYSPGALLDADLYPTAARYLSALPQGERSHPQCQVKGSVLRSMVLPTPARFPTKGLPEWMTNLVASPPMPSDWISEIAFNTLLLACEDSAARAAYAQWVYDRNRRLFESSLYRILFLVINPEHLVAGVASRWKAFRKGSELVCVERTKGRARLELRFPLHLQDENTLRNLCIALRAACDAAGGRNSRSELDSVDTTIARVNIRWD